jgi:hypothetical protein
MGQVTIFGLPGESIDENMGELLFSIQDAFQIRLPEDGPCPETVGKLCDIVIGRLNGTSARTCLTSVTFYKVRRALMDVLKVRRDLIAPATKLTALLSRGPRRRRQWKHLERGTGLRFPVLTHPDGLGWGLLIVSIPAAVVLLGPAHRINERMRVLFGSPVLAGILWMIAVLATRPLVWGLPNGCETVGDLVNLVLVNNYGTLANEAGGWNEREVWKVLCQLIASELGLDAASITRDTTFIEAPSIY